MKYKVVNTDLFINNNLIPENSIIDLSDSQKKGLEKFLVSAKSKDKVNFVVPKKNSNNIVNKSRSKNNKNK